MGLKIGPIGGGIKTVPKPSGTFSTAPASPSTSSGTTQSTGGSTQQSSAQRQSTSIPESLDPFSFYATPGASASGTAMNRAGVAAALSVPMPYRGSVVAITLSGTASISAGSLTANVRKNGSNLSGTTVCQVSWSSGTTAVARFTKGTFGFVRDDTLDVTFTTTSTYSPTTTVVEVTIYVTQDTSEIV